MHKQADQPIIIAGPCAAESYELLAATAEHLLALAKELGFKLWFKSSFAKANRSSINSYHGPGIEQTQEWFQKLKSTYDLKLLTDIHETHQAKVAAEFCDALQIPAFLCRQTDLLDSAIATGCFVNVKKGQFISHEATAHIVEKARAISNKHNVDLNLALTERGNVFGYNDLIVDMVGLPKMAEANVPVILDVTHACQRPGSGQTTKGQRAYAATLARAATATGYLGGYFIETHLDPKSAKSDAATQLSFDQSAALLRQIIPLWKQCVGLKEIDSLFLET